MVTIRSIIPALVGRGRTQGQAEGLAQAAQHLRAAVEAGRASCTAHLEASAPTVEAWMFAFTAKPLLDTMEAVAKDLDNAAKATGAQLEHQERICSALLAELERTQPGARGHELGVRLVRRVRRFLGVRHVRQ